MILIMGLDKLLLHSEKKIVLYMFCPRLTLQYFKKCTLYNSQLCYIAGLCQEVTPKLILLQTYLHYDLTFQKKMSRKNQFLFIGETSNILNVMASHLHQLKEIRYQSFYSCLKNILALPQPEETR